MEKTQLPIVLRALAHYLAFGTIASSVWGIPAVILGVVTQQWLLCVVGAIILGGMVLWLQEQRQTSISIEVEQITLCTGRSTQSFPYAGNNLLLRRSWTVTRDRAGTLGRGLADVAIQLRQDRRPLVTVRSAWGKGPEFERALTFLETLPIPKQYI